MFHQVHSETLSLMVLSSEAMKQLSEIAEMMVEERDKVGYMHSNGVVEVDMAVE